MAPTSLVLTSFMTLLRKETMRIFRIWPQTLLPTVVTQSLYFVIFGGFIGSRVGEVGGVDYMVFIVPGLVMSAVITNSYMNTVSSYFSMKFMRNIDEILVSPMPDWGMLAGFTAGGMVRGIANGALVYAVADIFTVMPVVHPWAVVLFLLLTSALFSLAGFLNGIYAKKFDDIGLVTTFFLVPLSYLGGVFYSIDQLPAFWQKLSMANPILYMVDGFRYGFVGNADVAVGWSIAILCAVIAGLWTWNIRLIRKGIGLRS